MFRPRLIYRLEEQLNARIAEGGFVYEALKVYMMLGGLHPPDKELIKSWMQRDWAENLRVPLLYAVNARPGPKLTPAELDARCAELLALVALADKAEQHPRDLTQVEMRKLELARAIAVEPKLLIADEAMAGLSQSEVTDIVALLVRLNERGITAW